MPRIMVDEIWVSCASTHGLASQKVKTLSDAGWMWGAGAFIRRRFFGAEQALNLASRARSYSIGTFDRHTCRPAEYNFQGIPTQSDSFVSFCYIRGRVISEQEARTKRVSLVGS